MADSTGDSKTFVQCYNTSCGLKFVESENHEEACTYHNGKPYFHDGYKEWTCCQMKSRDFTTFMSFHGCTKGRHSNVRPEVLGSKELEQNLMSEPQTNNSCESDLQASHSLESITLPDANLVENIFIVENPNLVNAPLVSNIIICKNCKKEKSTLDSDKPCLYHRGVQVFHDSLKYWNCCPNKKFTEFEDFQKLPPCAQESQHIFIAKVDTKENWFQADSTITIALYGLKGARFIETKSVASLKGGKQLNIRLVNIEGITIYENQWALFDYVIASGCKVTLNPSNVQIVLQKWKKPSHWPVLVLKEDA